jgi:hypothetical protein
MVFTAGTVLTASALNSNTLTAVSTYTPTVANAGTATWTTRTGWFHKIDKLVLFQIYLVVNAAGSGASGITITAPSNIDRSIRHIFATQGQTSGTTNGAWVSQANTSGSGNVIDRVNNSTGSQIVGSDLATGCIIAIQGMYREP